MDECWKFLPNELAFRIFEYLDAATRRDLGMAPRRLGTLPQLELHRDKILNTDFGVWLTIPKEAGTRVYQLMWNQGPFASFFYQRTNRIHFMTVPNTNVVVWRDTEVHQDLFTGVPAAAE